MTRQLIDIEKARIRKKLEEYAELLKTLNVRMYELSRFNEKHVKHVKMFRIVINDISRNINYTVLCNEILHPGAHVRVVFRCNHYLTSIVDVRREEES